MSQVVAVAQVVARAVPFSRITEAELPLPATKFAPSTSKGKLSTAPAITLDGKITSIVGPLVTATVALALFVESATLVAVTEIALGDGAAVGAVYRPFASTDPHAAPPHPWLAIALCTLHVTLALPVPVTLAKNCVVLKSAPEGATNAYIGETVTLIGPICPATVTIAVPLCDESALLVAARVTGFAAGTDPGAK